MNDSDYTPTQRSHAYAAIAGWSSGALFTCGLRAKRLREMLEKVEMDEPQRTLVLALVESIEETVTSAHAHERQQRADAGMDPLP